MGSCIGSKTKEQNYIDREGRLPPAEHLLAPPQLKDFQEGQEVNMKEVDKENECV